MNSVLLLEQFFYPEGWGGAQLPRDVACHLARNEWDVEVICGSDQYAPVDGDPGKDPADDGVRVNRVPRLIGGTLRDRKLVRQLWFYAAALPRILFRRSPAVFVTQTNPPLIVPLAALAARIHRRPLVIIAQDLYPEVVFAHRMMREESIVGRVLARLFQWAYRQAGVVVSLGPVMTSRLLDKGVESGRVHVISNWATGDESVVRGEENRLREAWGLAGRFVVVYSGNIGIAHDVETAILAVAEASRHDPRITLAFIGKGTRLPEARALVARLGVQSAVRFFDPVPFELLPHSLGLADFALVTLRTGFEGLVVPSKALGYLARGIPTLYVGPPSDIGTLVDDSGGGVVLPGGDWAGLASLLCSISSEPGRLSQMGESGASYYREHLDKAIALEKYASLVRSLVAKHGDRR